MVIHLVGLLDLALLAEAKERGAVRPQLGGNPGARHLVDEVEGEVRVLLRGGQAGDAGEGGLIGGNGVGAHLVEDLEATFQPEGTGVVGGVGEGGAKVEEDVVVVEGEGGGGGASGVVKAEGLGEVATLAAHVEMVAEEALGGLTAGLLLGPS